MVQWFFRAVGSKEKIQYTGVTEMVKTSFSYLGNLFFHNQVVQ